MKVRLVLLLTVVCTLHMSAMARPANYTAAERRATMSDYSNCIVGKEADLAREVITDFSIELSEETYQRRRRLSDFKCIPESLRSDLVVMRMTSFGAKFGLAEALWHVEFADSDVDFSGLAPLDHPQPPASPDRPKGSKLSKEQFAERIDDLKKLRLFSRLGECISRNDPVGSRSLLLTQVASDAESKAIDKLLPVVSRCLSGGSLALLPDQLRGAVAFSHYRLQAAKMANEGQQPNA